MKRKLLMMTICLFVFSKVSSEGSHLPLVKWSNFQKDTTRILQIGQNYLFILQSGIEIGGKLQSENNLHYIIDKNNRTFEISKLGVRQIFNFANDRKGEELIEKKKSVPRYFGMMFGFAYLEELLPQIVFSRGMLSSDSEKVGLSVMYCGNLGINHYGFGGEYLKQFNRFDFMLGGGIMHSSRWFSKESDDWTDIFFPKRWYRRSSINSFYFKGGISLFTPNKLFYGRIELVSFPEVTNFSTFRNFGVSLNIGLTDQLFSK